MIDPDWWPTRETVGRPFGELLADLAARQGAPVSHAFRTQPVHHDRPQRKTRHHV